MKLTNVLKPVITLLALGLAGCYHTVDINFERVPRVNVYIPFNDGQWNAFGAKAPLDARRFIRPTGTRPGSPAGYAYPEYSFTGFGGVLQVCDIHGTLRAFDLSCPVECSPDVLVVVDYSTNLARCPQCGSTYDVFLLNGSDALAGGPVDGPALTRGYGLRRYNVLFGVDGRDVLISR